MESEGSHSWPCPGCGLETAPSSSAAIPLTQARAETRRSQGHRTSSRSDSSLSSQYRRGWIASPSASTQRPCVHQSFGRPPRRQLPAGQRVLAERDLPIKRMASSSDALTGPHRGPDATPAPPAGAAALASTRREAARRSRPTPRRGLHRQNSWASDASIHNRPAPPRQAGRDAGQTHAARPKAVIGFSRAGLARDDLRRPRPRPPAAGGRSELGSRVDWMR